MAANNYYGFTHAGTQYGTQYTPSANNISITGQQQQQQQPYSQQYSSAPVTVPTGQSYNIASSSDQNNYSIGGYTRTIAQASAQTPQAYYTTQQPNTMGNSTQQQQQQLQQQQSVFSSMSMNSGMTSAGTSSGSGAYQNYLQPVPIQTQTHQATTAATGSKAPTFTNYDAAVYNAVTAYAQGSTGGGGGRPHGGLGFTKRGGHHGNKNMMKGSRPMSNKPLTLHYCDVCKISCAGPQTYKEHLEGQKHKKKEISAKSDAPVPKGAPPGLRCELCDVVCTGSDAYAAHIRGAKHQKVLKLHTKLGKPIPSTDPTVVTATGALITSSATQSKPASAATTNNNAKANNNGPTGISAKFAKPAAPASAPKINFIGPKDGDRFLSTTATAKPAAVNSNANLSTTYPLPTVSGSGTITPAGCSVPMLTINNKSASATKPATATTAAVTTAADYTDRDKEIQPVGQDYIEEIRTDDGKGITFNCKLCDCKFNDPNAKEMHMKGRRHRLQYKKKVNPSLVVDMKPSSRQKKSDEKRPSRGGRRLGLGAEPMYARGPPVPLFPPMPARNFGPSPPNFGMFPPIQRRMDSLEDRHVMEKHASIYPTEEELQAIQKIVSATEKALKYVSDAIAEDDATKAMEVVTTDAVAPVAVSEIKQEVGTEGSTEIAQQIEDKPPVQKDKFVQKHLPKPRTEAELQAYRTLKGVMRVGDLAKGLLLRGDRSVHLVVLCSVKPTLPLLDRVISTLPDLLKAVSPDDSYDIRKEVKDAAVVISSQTEPKIEVLVTLTSPLLRSGPAPVAVEGAAGEATATMDKDPDDLLDKDKCLDALAALRHAKWFQARATTVQSCVILIRVLRELAKRVPAWNCLTPWAIELLTEKSISTVGAVTAGEGIRLVFEVISSGILLPFGPGLVDPCEKDPTDALRTISPQGREDVTLYAQQALRQIQFGQIHKVLGIEEIQDSNNANSRKRRRDIATSGETDETDSTIADGKKDKKESSGEVTSTTADIEIKTE